MQTTIGMAQLAAGDGEFRNLIEDFGEGAQCAGPQLCIVIEEQNEIARGLREALIYSTGKTRVARIANDLYARRGVFETENGIIAAAIVYNDDLRSRDIFMQDGLHTIGQQRTAVVVHDDNGEARGGIVSGHRRSSITWHNADFSSAR